MVGWVYCGSGHGKLTREWVGPLLWANRTSRATPEAVRVWLRYSLTLTEKLQLLPVGLKHINLMFTKIKLFCEGPEASKLIIQFRKKCQMPWK